VVGPEGEEVHTDELGRIKVQFHWQRADEHPGSGANLDDKSSCWLRVAMPSAGAGWGHQFIPRIGQEVLVDFIEGDIDRPVIVGVLYNGSHATPAFSGAGALPANKTLSGIKSKEHQGGQYNELLFDDTPGEVRAKLSSEPGKTQLNQGFLTHPRSNGKAQPRGEGFELRTDQHGAIRAATACCSAPKRKAALGANNWRANTRKASSTPRSASAKAWATPPLRNWPTAWKPGRTPSTPTTAKTATKTAATCNTTPPHSKPGKPAAIPTKTAKPPATSTQAGQQPLLILSAPAGIASLTEQSQTLSAGTNLNLIAQRDANHTTGRRWLHNVGQHISLFVAGVKDKVALKLIAAKGKVQVQAQSDAMELTADKDVTITSSKERIVVNAKQEILLTSGGGYIRLKGGNIEIHCPGTVSVKGASHNLSGPDQMNPPLPSFPNTVCKPCMAKAFNQANPLVAAK
jgi:type VI secretion system secreted protein VgrG